MSKEVKRYSYGYVDDGNGNRYLGLIEKPDGNLVKHEDYKALLDERDALAKDAERYRWLRMADWWDSHLCAVRNPAKQVKLGSDCPSRDRLDDAIDAALQGAQP